MTKTQELATGDHTTAGSIISDAFADDPVNRWIFGNEVGMNGYFTLAAKKLYLAKGYGHRLGDDGCTLWLPPGVPKAIPLTNSLDIAISMVRHSGVSSVLRGTRVDASLDARHPAEPHHYLFAIGTRPAMQGQGIGGRLMAAGLERADADGMPAYLESSKESNIAFYQRFGFEVTEQVVPTDGCPPLWLMWREARAAGQAQIGV